MRNPHLIVAANKRCLCRTYNILGVTVPVCCADIIKSANDLAAKGDPDGLVISRVLRELIEDRG